MKKRGWFIGWCLVLSWGLASLAEAKLVIPKKPGFADAQEEEVYYLRRGQVLTAGDYVGEAVHIGMDGLIWNRPELLWQLFTRTNDWRDYHLPNVADSQAVTREQAEHIKAMRWGDAGQVKAYLAAAGPVDPLRHRVPGGRWVSYQYEYYNLPWPVADRWIVVENHYDESRAAEGLYRTDWSLVAGLAKLVRGELVFSRFDGEAALTRMVYNGQADLGTQVPRFLLKWGLKMVMPNVYKAIREQAARREPPSGAPIPMGIVGR